MRIAAGALFWLDKRVAVYYGLYNNILSGDYGEYLEFWKENV
jgi:hypothetical protein